MARPRPRLRRVLGLTQITASGVGIIIGAGIYVLLGPATASAGGLVWLSFVVAAVLCGLTALSYAELASMFPRAGAEHEYTRQVFPAGIAFVVGWSMAIGLVIAAAAIALGFGRYLREFVDLDARLGAWAVLALITIAALTGIRKTSWLVVALSTVQVGGLVVVTAIGIGHIGEVDLLSGNGASGVVGAAALVFFAFIGFDEVITLAEETRDPVRTVPRALLLALLISTVLYVTVSISSVSVLGPEALGRSTRPLADVMTHVVGASAVKAMAVVALLTTANTTLLAVTASSRLTFGMADRGSLPQVFGRIDAQGVPRTAVLTVVVLAAAFVAAGDLRLVAEATDFAIYVVFLAVNATVVGLRVRQPAAPRPFRTPIAIGRVPILPIGAVLATLAMMTQLGWGAIAIGVGLLVSGAAAHLVLHRTSAR